MQRFQKLYKLRSIRIYVKSSSSNEEAMDAALPGLRAVIARYEPYDVFNMDKINVWELRNLYLG